MLTNTTIQLCLHLTRSRDCVEYVVTCNEFHVTGDRANSIGRTFDRLVTAVIDSPYVALEDLEYVSEVDEENFAKWNITLKPPVERRVHDLILEQVHARPNHEALYAWDGKLTYNELWRYAGYIASQLVDLGVGPEVRVALCFEKSVWATVAMLGVLIAGGGFSLLDPTQPPARLKTLVARLEAKVLLSSKLHAARLKDIAVRVLSVSSESDRRAPSPTRNTVTEASPSNVAYVHWTSGSTGEPKGVVVEHRAYCSGIQAHAPAYRFTSESRVLQYASYAFDASIIETLTTLATGGTVCVPSEESRINDLAGTINEMGVNWSVLTPSVANFLDPSAVPTLKTLLLVGEAMSREHTDAWGGKGLINGYGPAEASVAATANSNVQSKEPARIGHGLGVACWVVNPNNHNQRVPVGAVGELLLQGPTLARGYLDAPEKTSKAFIQPPPWCHMPGTMYKTGDLVKQDPNDGSLTFVGRKDNQVKHHGQRIELGEIECSVKSDSAVHDAIVLLPRHGPCKHKLVVIVSLQGAPASSVKDSPPKLELLRGSEREEATQLIRKARDGASERLPAYMIPSIWLVARLMPLQRTGKLDRRSIADSIDQMKEEEYASWTGAAELHQRPANEMERLIRQMWGHVLNLPPDRIGPQQSFLAAGGDSISAMMLKNHSQKQGLQMAVQDILRARSVASLAKLTRAVDKGVKYDERIEEDFDLSPIQTMYFALSRERAGHFNQSFFLRLARPFDGKAIRQAVRAIVSRHAMLRSRFRLSDEDDEWKQRITMNINGSFRFEVHQSHVEDDTVPVISRRQASLDAVRGPLFGADLFNMDDGQQLLFLVGHHLVIDLVSWRVILEDLEELLANPSTAAPPATSVPFQAWCRLQTEHAHGLSLGSVLPPSEMPYQGYSYWGMEGRPNMYGDVACKGFELDASTTSLIASKAHEALRTDTLDVLVASMIYSFTQVFKDRPAPAVFNESHGRETWDRSVDLSRTVGWFTSMYPIYVCATDASDFVETLKRVKDYRRRVPASGRPYFASRVLTSKGAKKFKGHWPIEFTFNYLGVYQQLEREGSLLVPAKDMAGEQRGAGGISDVGYATPCFGLFETSAVIVRGKLRFSFTFNKQMKHQDQIAQWITSCQDILQTKATELAQMAHVPTLTDFPLLSLSYDGLEKLTQERLPRVGLKDVSMIEDIYPCTQTQQGLLISTQRDSGHYAVHGTYRVKPSDQSNADAGKLRQAWQTIVDRHPALRTIFIESSSQDEALYDQVVLRDAPAQIVGVDGAGVDPLEALNMLVPMTWNPAAPPHQLSICTTPAGELIFRIEISHTIIDGDSWSIIFRELEAIYNGRLEAGRGPSYSDFVRYVSSHPAGPGLAHWTTYLADVEPCTFPILNDAVEVPEKKLQSLRVRFDDVSELQRLCNSQGVTSANVFHTAWAMALQCYTGSDDVCFGFLTSSRDLPIEGIDAMVGYLVNMLICRVRLDRERPLESVIAEVQDDYMESLAHRQTALSEVFHALKMSNSLFNTALSYRKLPPTPPTEHGGATIEECAPYYDPTEYAVSINIEAEQETFAINLDYWTDHLSEKQASNVADTFLQALNNIIHHGKDSIGQLSTLGQHTLQQISGWNHALPAYVNRCVHDFIEEQRNRRPSAPAVCGWDASFTYEELETVMRKLSGHLREHGVGPGSLVCFCFDKSSYTIIAMLGVLRAGGAVVSLDPNYPPPALQSRIRDTQARLVLCSPEYVHRFVNMVPQVVAVNQSLLDSLPVVGAAQTPSARPNDPCFVVYTSGSTGVPKGVVLEHRALVTSAHAHGPAAGFNHERRTLQFSNYTFDNSLAEIFTTLMYGGTVCVPCDYDRLYDLPGAINKLAANYIDTTPTVLSYVEPAQVPTIKTVAFGGEALTKRALGIWCNKVEVLVMYGPSECSVNSTFRGSMRHSSDIYSIGRAVGCLTWIVDLNNHERLVPIGCEGELLIEGPILAREYLNNPEKTSLSFIKNPAWAQPLRNDCRMYKTGDICRYNSDGTIAYLGRKDHQIKLNGQRIELGEIEHQTKSHLPTEWQFAVELVTPGSAEAAKCLAAFLTPASGEGVPSSTHDSSLLPLSAPLEPTMKSLEAHLQTCLPPHMVPSMYIPLAKLPLSSSGKLDRARLRATAIALTGEQAATYRFAGAIGRAPESQMEKALADLWESILDIPAGSIGMDAQFFRMGGDSIAAIRLVTAARAEGIQLTVAKVFRQATLREMCESANQTSTMEMDSVPMDPKPFSLLPKTSDPTQCIKELASLCEVESSAIEDIYPCTAMQEGLMALTVKQPGAYVVTNKYRLDSINPTRLREAWEAVASKESILRTRIVHTDSLGFVQAVVNEPISWSEGAELDSPLLPAYNGGPLIRLLLKSNESRESSLLLTMHHALYDGWSLSLLLQKVLACYKHPDTENSVPSPHYSRFVQYLSSVDENESEAFWRSNLEGCASHTFPTLPVSTYQPTPTSFWEHDIVFSRDSNDKVTSAVLIRAAWARAMSAYSNSDDVVFAETVTGRDAPVPSLLDIVGPTIATIPSRVMINQEQSVADYLDHVQGNAIDSMPHQHIGLQRIRKLSTDAAKACEFQTLIAINGLPTEQSKESWACETGATGDTAFFTYALIVSFDIGASNAKLDVQYDCNAISQWQVERLVSHFEHVLNQISLIDARSMKLGNLKTLSSADQGIIEEWNSTIPEPIYECIHSVVAGKVRAQPHAPAVCAWDAKLSYEELNRSASGLAHWMCQRGVQPRTLLPVLLEKSSAMVIVQLAILKLGSAFIPLDVEAPEERLRGIVHDLGSSVVMCSPQYASTGRRIAPSALSIDTNAAPPPFTGEVSAPSNPSDVAYIIYTSGSTGKPKGVMVPHSAFVTSATAHGRAMGMSSSTRVLQFAASVFDASVMDVFTTLIHGGCICVPDNDARLNDTAKAISDMNVNWALLTPSFAQLLSPSSVPGLDTLVLGGEAVGRAHAATWLGHTRVINSYGPSETSVIATVNNQISVAEDAPRIGHAVGGRCWIVDRNNPHRLVPVGSVGELVVEGPILATGYFNDPQKTAAAFLSKLSWAEDFALLAQPPSRFYLTGDLVRYHEDGSFTYLGRKDTQIKLHGQRMELGEVEHHLQVDPSVRHVSVLIPSSGHLQKRLTAVLSLKGGSSRNSEASQLRVLSKAEAAPVVSQLRFRLGEKLQGYMIPSDYIILESFPFLPSGKLDRKRISSWLESLQADVVHELSGHEEGDVVKPTTTTETKLQEILVQVLGSPIEQVSLRQSFVQLGGDSILAIQLVSRCRVNGLGLTVQNILRSPSISHLASQTTLAQTAQAFEDKLDTNFALSPIQSIFVECVRANINHFNQSVSLRLRTAQAPSVIKEALGRLIDAHSMLRARFTHDNDGIWSQFISRDASETFVFTAHTSPTTSDEMRRSIERSQQSLDVTKGPVFRAEFFSTAEEEKPMLVLVAHHLVIDVVSWSIVLQDMGSLLSEPRRPLQPSIPFQAWAHLQQERAQEQLARAGQYNNDIPSADFAYWGMRNQPNVYGDVKEDAFELDAPTSQLLLGACHKTFETEPIDIFIGSILHALARAFPKRSFLPAVFNEAHGREPWDTSLDLSRTIGWFTTACPFFLPEEITRDADIVTAICWAKDLRRRRPQNGRESFAYHHLTEQGRDRIEGQWPTEILFNYLGQDRQFKKLDSMFEFARDVSQPFDIGSQTPRLALFEISAMVSDNILRFTVGYNRHMKHQSAIREWISSIKTSLQQAAGSLPKAVAQPTFSDFPLLPMSHNGLSKLKEKLPSMGVSSLNDLDNVSNCSPMQEGVLLSQIKKPNLYRYSAVFSVETSGPKPLDAKRFARAWRDVIRRHSSLRTVFVQSLHQEGKIGQAVLKDVTPRIVWVPLEDSDAHASLNTQRPIDFSEPRPPHRLMICQATKATITCKLEMSHAICDGTSVPILLRDLAELYDQAPALPAAPSYGDYMLYLGQVPRDEAISYWRSYLDKFEPCFFPSLAEGSVAQSELRTLEVELPCAGGLQSFCARTGVTLSNMLQLAWALVLRAYIGSSDVCFGYLASGRDVPVPGIQNSVGLFANILLCRAQLADDEEMEKALLRIQSEYAQSMAYQTFSLAEIQHELALSSKSLFNTAFSYQKRQESSSPSISSLVYNVADVEDPSEYDLTVNVEAYDASIKVHFNYWTGFLSPDRAADVASCFEEMVAAIQEKIGVHESVGSVALCTGRSLQQILEWNSAPLPKREQSIHDIVTQNVQSSPELTQAVSSWDSDLTYQELDVTADRMASHLVSLGIGPQAIVPLHLERSSMVIVSMLAVLKAGAAFVSLDPSHPESRVKFIIDTVEAKLVICSEKYHKRVAKLTSVPTLVLEDMPNLWRFSKPSSLPYCDPRSPAYVIFTSGTTGVPKGTIISHAAFATSATEHARAMCMRGSSRVLQFANFVFDASVMEILTTLIVGGCICIPSEEERSNDIPGAIRRMSVNWTLLTPSVARILQPKDVPSLKILVTGGEAMVPGHISLWRDHASVVNAYGPSETAVIAAASIKVDETGSLLNEDAATIGHAVGSRSWIVSPSNHNQLVPVGCVGELLVEGNIVASGYLKEEEKTAKAFIPDPIWMKHRRAKDDRIRSNSSYLTGDLVQYTADGSLRYIKRKDTQIKLNGLRIELGEIEHHVRQHVPEDFQVVVDVVQPVQASKTLAVFFASACLQDESTSMIIPDCSNQKVFSGMSNRAFQIASTLKEDLTEVLPSYMVPSLYVPAVKIPITAAGKVDRTQLRQTVSEMTRENVLRCRLSNSNCTHIKQSPTNDMEARLRRLWEAVLGIEADSFTKDDDFFSRGADSVQAMRLVAAAREARIKVTVLDVFRKPKLSEMAASCCEVEESDDADVQPFSLIPKDEPLDQFLDEVAVQCRVRKDEVVDAYPCTPLQEGLLTLTIQQQGAYTMRNVFVLPEAVDAERFKKAWETAIREVDILRTRVVYTSNSRFVQVVLKDDQPQWHLTASLEDTSCGSVRIPEHNGSALMQFEIVNSGGSSPRYFVWSIHHALYDGWSMPLMLKKVEDLYFDITAEKAVPPFNKFIRFLVNVDDEACKKFWQSRFEGLQAVHFPKLCVTESTATQTLSRSLDLSETGMLHGITVPSVIRGAWALLLSAHTGSEDVMFGETLTGRDVPVDGITEIVGPLLTTVPTRIQVDAGMSVLEYLQSVHQMAASVIPFQHTGLQNIRRLNEDTQAACDFQNLLVIQMLDDDSEDSRLWQPLNNGVGSNFFTYPLTLECKVSGTQIHFDAHYDNAVISGFHVERLLYQFSHIFNQLRSVGVSEELKISDIETASPQDLELIRRWNSYSPQLVERCIHQIFIDMAKLQPQAQAVCAWDGDLTYDELVNHALRLCTELQSHGVGPETLVPFCIEKSRWSVVALLGILMAGGAMVPFDPSHPITRHEEIILDTRSTLMLCSPQFTERYSTMVRTLIPVGERSMKALPSTGAVDTWEDPVMPENTAYCLFTSGSTGKPKGVVVDHRAFCTSSAGYTQAMNMKSISRVFNFASLTFDVGLMENLSALMLGACVCIPSVESKLEDLSRTIDHFQASWAFLTPSVANLLTPASSPSLKTLVTGGEAMTPEVVTRWAEQVELINGYGPTEACVISVVNPAVSQEKNSASIGRAHPTGFAWIVDPIDHTRIAPIGSAGELALGGPILARRYLNDQEKTDAVFIDDVEWQKQLNNSAASSRLYLTGDLVQYDRTGNMMYIGRKDNQVKLHGQRMELEEIESRLESHPRVRHAVTVLPRTGFYKKQLVTVLSFADIPPVRDALVKNKCIPLTDHNRLQKAHGYLTEVKNAVAEQLPAYMLPTKWVVVETVPIMVSGKQDRKQVLRWIETTRQDVVQRRASAEDEAARGARVEGTLKILRDVWAQIFNMKAATVRIDLSFIAQGGDSLIAMSALPKCRKLGITLSLQEVLKSKSLVQLAELVDSRGSSARAILVGRKEKVDHPFDLSPVQRMYFQSATPTSTHTQDFRFNQSQLLRFTKYIKAVPLQRAIETIVQHHSMLRARFERNSSGVWQQRIVSDVKSSHCFREHHLDGLTSVATAVSESQNGLDIARGPLFAVDLFNINGVGQGISLVAHHLVVDVVSWNIILQDLEDLLSSEDATIDSPLSFQSWCEMQQEQATQRSPASVKAIMPSTVKRANMGFWGMVGNPNCYSDLVHSSFQLNETLSRMALGECNRCFRTQVDDILLTVILSAFKRTFSSRSAPTIFTEGHGRESWANIDLSRTVGWFTALSPTYVSIEPAEDVVETLKQVKDARRSVPDNGRPYFAHRYLTPDGRWRFGDHMPMEILFNNTGRMQQLERADALFGDLELPTDKTTAELASDVGPDTTRFALFEISVSTVNDQIHFNFIWNQQMKYQQEIREWISECERSFAEIVGRLCNAPLEATLSDYPMLPTNYAGLTRHLSQTLPEIGVSSIEEIEEMHVCAPTQEGLLLAQIRNPDSYQSYLIMEFILVDGTKADPQRLVRAWQHVVDRHQTLRTAFVYSVVKDRAFDAIVLKKVDGAAKVIHCEDSDLRTKFDEISLRKENLTRRPMLPQQFSICMTASGRCYVKMEVNHAVIDGASAALMARDVALAYQDLLPGGPKPLYSDYIRHIHSTPLSEGVNYWKTYLKDVKGCHLPVLDGCSEQTRELTDTGIEFKRFDELQAFVKENGFTMSNVMLMAWAIVLRMYTSQDDISFGNMTAGRDVDIPGIAESVGAYLNMLCVRVLFEPKKTLKELCSQAQADYLESLPHQYCSLAKMQNELGFWGRSIFNTCASVQNQVSSRDAELSKAAIQFEPVHAHDPTEFAVTLNIRTAPGSEMVVLRYWTSSISKEQCQKLMQNYANVLAAFLDDPNQTILDLDTHNKAVSESNVTAVSKELMAAGTNTEAAIAVQPTVLRDVVKECVSEVLSQMFSSGEIVTYKSKEGSSADAGDSQPKQSSLKDDVKDQVKQHLEIPEPSPKKEKKQLFKIPRPSERILTPLKALWSSVLDLAEAEVNEVHSFFELGGDSVRAMALVGIAREAGIALNVGDVFNLPNILELARNVEKDQLKETTRTRVNKMTELPDGAAKAEVMVYRHFSLLPTSNVESFLRDHVSPRISVFRGGIVDVLPTTDFQSLAVAGAMMDSRWMVNYFILDGSGSLNLVRFKKAANRIVDAYDILRAVFIPYGNQFFQVILRKLQPHIQVFETDDDLTEYTQEFCNRNREVMPRLAEPFLQFTVIKGILTDHHRIVMRLSHAQYDGICLSRIVGGLQYCYEGKQLSPTTPFANYVKSAVGSDNDDRYKHWRMLLQGSAMTEIVRRRRPSHNKSDPTTAYLLRDVKLASLASHNITPATVLKSAWALTLAQMTGRSDVVFGNVTSGRNNALPGVETIVGPCMNVVPARVLFEKQWTVLNLFRHVQNQQVASMPFESLGFREIIKKCTDWADWSFFTSTIQHQNIDQGVPFRLGNTEYTLSGIGSQDTMADIAVVSTPRGNDTYEVAVSFGEDSAAREFAEKAFAMLCSLAEDLAAHPSRPVPSPKDLAARPGQSVPPPTAPPAAEPAPSTALRAYGKRDILRASDALGRAWRAVLPSATAGDASDVVRLDRDFDALGGDVVAWAQLAAFLEGDGINVRVEDLMERPTMGEQLALLCRRRAQTALRASSSSTLASSDESGQEAVRDIAQQAKGEPPQPLRRVSNTHPILQRRQSSFWDKAGGLARKMVDRQSKRNLRKQVS